MSEHVAAVTPGASVTDAVHARGVAVRLTKTVTVPLNVVPLPRSERKCRFFNVPADGIGMPCGPDSEQSEAMLPKGKSQLLFVALLDVVSAGQEPTRIAGVLAVWAWTTPLGTLPPQPAAIKQIPSTLATRAYFTSKDSL